MRLSLYILICLCAVIFILAPEQLRAEEDIAPAPYANRQIEDPVKEAQAKALMEELRCLQCQSQSIADSDAEMAADMRSQVRERIMMGDSPEQVRGWLIERYGYWVSYDPPLSRLTWPLWVTPIILMLIAIFMANHRFRGKTRKEQE